MWYAYQAETRTLVGILKKGTHALTHMAASVVKSYFGYQSDICNFLSNIEIGLQIQNMIDLVHPKTSFFLHGISLRELQSCALILSDNFHFIFTFKYCTTKFSH